MARIEPPTHRIRPIVPDDREALARFYADLSEDSREARFLGATPTIGENVARFFCGPDHVHREGLVAEALLGDGCATIIGHICLEPLARGEAEMAIAVADAWQHQGVGQELLSEAAAWARRHRIDRLVASMRWSNSAVIALIRSVGYPVAFGSGESGVLDVEIQLPAQPRAA
jgi:RimJ/RimL family protein N-acetyltransferase